MNANEQTDDAVSIKQFCENHGFSIALYYKMRAAGEAPVEMKLGDRRLISREAAAAWRRSREQVAVAAE